MSWRGLADDIRDLGPTAEVGTHGTNQRTVDTGSQIAKPVDKAHIEETGNIMFWARTCLVLSPAYPSVFML